MAGWGHGPEQNALGGVRLLLTTSVAAGVEKSSHLTTSHLLKEGVVSNNYMAAILSNEMGLLHSER